MSKLIAPGLRNAADFYALVDPKVCAGQGYKVVGIYLKNATRAQVDAYHKAGIAVYLIHERGASDGLKGATAGAEHGAQAKAQAEALGMPHDLPIVFASMGDYDVTDKNVKVSVDYYLAARQACKPYPAGRYGDFDLLQACELKVASPLNVQAAAKWWSWNHVTNKWRGAHPSAHVLQLPSKQITDQGSPEWPGVRVDPCDVLKPFTAWYPTPAVPPRPPISKGTVPKPTLRWLPVNMRGPQVFALQTEMAFFGWHRSPITKRFDLNTKFSVQRMQKALKVKQDGIYGPVTAQAYLKFKKALAKL